MLLNNEYSFDFYILRHCENANLGNLPLVRSFLIYVLYHNICFRCSIEFENWNAKEYTSGRTAYRFVTLICY